MVFVTVRGWVEEKLASRGTKICWDPRVQGVFSLETGMGQWREGRRMRGAVPHWEGVHSWEHIWPGGPEAHLHPPSSTEDEGAA